MSLGTVANLETPGHFRRDKLEPAGSSCFCLRFPHSPSQYLLYQELHVGIALSLSASRNINIQSIANE